MKNAVIVVLLVIIFLLAFQNLHREVTAEVKNDFSVPAAASETHAAATRSTTEAKATSGSTSGAVAPQNYIPQQAVEIVRQGFTKAVALQYSAFFARAKLSKTKTDLLLDLLVDRWMVGLEPDVQDAGADPLKSTKNDKLIEDLVGAEGFAELEAARVNYLADQAAQDAIEGIFGANALGASQNESVAAALRGYQPDKGLGDLISSRQQVTPEIEANLRSGHAAQTKAAASSLRDSLSRTDIEKFISWSDAQFEKQLTFVKAIQASQPKQ